MKLPIITILLVATLASPGDAFFFGPLRSGASWIWNTITGGSSSDVISIGRRVGDQANSSDPMKPLNAPGLEGDGQDIVQDDAAGADNADSSSHNASDEETQINAAMTQDVSGDSARSDNPKIANTPMQESPEAKKAPSSSNEKKVEAEKVISRTPYPRFVKADEDEAIVYNSVPAETM